MKILVADDHAVLRQGLKEVLGQVADWEVVAEAADGFEVLPLVESSNPDVVILDLVMPNLGGLETIHRLTKDKPELAILVLSSKSDEGSAREAIDAGAKGYVTKSSDMGELEFAIRSLLQGYTYISPSVAAGVVNNRDSNGSGTLSVLSSREREIARLLCQGTPNRDIAKLLHISPRTVDSHRANILKKLGITSNAELTKIAVKAGLID